MSPFKRILVPVDFGGCSGSALKMACRLANDHDAEIDVLHVWEAPRLVGSNVMLHIPGVDGQASLERYVHDQAEEELKKLIAEFGTDDVTLNPRLRTGAAAAIIVEIAGAEKFDLVIVGAHGRKRFMHRLMGSVAIRVVHHSPCPVLTVSSDIEI